MPLYFSEIQGEGVPPLHYMALKIPGKVGGTPSCHTWGGSEGRVQAGVRVRPGSGQGQAVKGGGQAEVRLKARPVSKTESSGAGHIEYGQRVGWCAGRKWLRCSHEAVLKTRLGAGVTSRLGSGRG